MDLPVERVTGLVRRPGFWLMVIVLVLITLPYYEEALAHPPAIARLFTSLGLERHSFERILYLAPIIWAGFLFGRRGALMVSILALALMLPYAAFISATPVDDVLEAVAVFIAGNVIAFTVASLHEERLRRTEIEKVQRRLQHSEERYRGIFENALDAIWLHDMDGNILAANASGARLTGYTEAELRNMNVRSFLSEASLQLAGDVRRKLLGGEPVKQPYEQHLLRKDGSEAYIQLVTSVVRENGTATAFQHIARDVTEQKRLQENLRYYTQQATSLQEKERKRISREIYDETIQEMVVISRQLDDIASDCAGIPENDRASLRNVWEQTNSLIDKMRRLGHDLRPASLDHLGLVPALQSLASDIMKRSGITVHVEVRGARRRLSEEAELVIFRVVEEALRNIHLHSGASRAEIDVRFTDTGVKVTVADNGMGSDLPALMSDLVREGKLGLVGMQERALSLGGQFSVKSGPGTGTTISIEAPDSVPARI